MNPLTRCVAATGLVALTLAGAGGRLSRASADQDVIGHVYVNDNTAGANTVAGFTEHADGSLTPLPGSPFSVGGAGLGSGLGSQDAIVTALEGRLILVADAGSNQVSVLTVGPEGTPQPVPGSPFASGGTEPVSIATHQNLVYVANNGGGTTTPAVADYAGFSLDFFGRLTPLPGGTVPVPLGSGLGDVLFSADGSHLAGIRVATALIDSFAVDSAGRLSPAPGSPFNAQAPGPFGSEFRPGNPSQLFVSNAHGGTLAGSVSAFQVAPNSALSPLGSSPFPRPADGTVLVDDFTRWPVPVHRECRQWIHLQLPDRPQRIAGSARHADAGRHTAEAARSARRRGGQPPLRH